MDKSTLLHRQIHPNFIQHDKVSALAFAKTSELENVSQLSFRPRDDEDNKISVYNGDTFSPEEAFNHYTANRQSTGSLSVSIEEVNSIELVSVADNDPFEGHAHIDYGDLDKKAMKVKAAELRRIAITRDWTHRTGL